MLKIAVNALGQTDDAVLALAIVTLFNTVVMATPAIAERVMFRSELEALGLDAAFERVERRLPELGDDDARRGTRVVDDRASAWGGVAPRDQLELQVASYRSDMEEDLALFNDQLKMTAGALRSGLMKLAEAELSFVQARIYF